MHAINETVHRVQLNKDYTTVIFARIFKQNGRRNFGLENTTCVFI